LSNDIKSSPHQAPTKEATVVLESYSPLCQAKASTPTVITHSIIKQRVTTLFKKV
jgi:hypothetical protein